ncbi:hypothetical protein GUJ93_ZPchr0008g13451 [Zizania palustris]|uniref:Uncharacterized protein n=1 Tax=Zizania palustris TaxID=103762 RepID=A0A8J5V3U1_ZIZPA|nr:hypothetical protein GUJ93_ZPchr0008g13451 [Zizania palustris]
MRVRTYARSDTSPPATYDPLPFLQSRRRHRSGAVVHPAAALLAAQAGELRPGSPRPSSSASLSTCGPAAAGTRAHALHRFLVARITWGIPWPK